MACRYPIVKAMVVIRRPGDGALLVSDDTTPGGARYQRPLGGRVEFGEHAADAVLRELREEIGQVLTEIEYVGILENFFEVDAVAGHEIVFVFRASFADEDAYDIEDQPIRDHLTGRTRVRWRLPGTALPPLVPAGLAALMEP
jgi:ADP-ribose pyrophosphatase YjhB (NUDIX family)